MGAPWENLIIREYQEGEEISGFLLLRGDGRTGGEEKAGGVPERGTVLWLNERGKYRMYTAERREQFLRMLPLVVREGEREHTMYFYSERSEVNRMAEEFRQERYLPFQDTTLSMEELSDEEMRIRMLEGILAATEKRLLEYIETEKELRQEIKRLKETEGKRGWS